MLGAQALVMSALQGSQGYESGWSLAASGDGSQQGKQGLKGTEAQGRKQLKKAISAKMQRQVRGAQHAVPAEVSNIKLAQSTD